MNIYYIYAYLREDKTPYYIGKGSGYRINSKQRVIPIPPKERRVKLAEGLSESDAFALETKLIEQYGRIDLGTGILRNLSDGGKAPPSPKGRIPWNKGIACREETKQKLSKQRKGKLCSEEAKAKISKANKGKRVGEDNPFYGKTHTPEVKQLIREHSIAHAAKRKS